MSKPNRNRINVFISHRGRDQAWAEWVAWQLEQHGISVELDVWDWIAGDNFISRMNAALDRADVILLVVSKTFFEAGSYTESEWTAAAVRARQKKSRLVPILIEQVTVPALLSPIISVRIFGVDDAEARRRLLEAVRGPSRPQEMPVFPGAIQSSSTAAFDVQWQPRLPRTMPQTWNVPVRNPDFVGRNSYLVKLRKELRVAGRVAIRTLHGLGGVGKTQIATEYAHRFAMDYDAVWWLNAEQAELIPGQLLLFGHALGITDSREVVSADGLDVVKAYLRENGRWLVVLDNAADADSLREVIPQGGGHVLITSRNPSWPGTSRLMNIEEFRRSESIALLRTHCARLSRPEAAQLAERLGDLPLALAQSASFLSETGMGANEYASLLGSHADKLLDSGTSSAYPQSLSAVVFLSERRLARTDPEALQILRLGAFFAPEVIPAKLFINSPVFEPWSREAGSNADTGVKTLRVYRHFQLVTRIGLAKAGSSGIVFHRLTQAVIRDQLPASTREAIRREAVDLLVAADPGDPDNPEGWTAWGILSPHLLHLSADSAATPELRRLVCSLIWNMLERGQPAVALQVAKRIHSEWAALIGLDDELSLLAAYCLGRAYRDQGQFKTALQIDEDTFVRRKRVLGDAHTETLRSANNLGNTLRGLSGLQLAAQQNRRVSEVNPAGIKYLERAKEVDEFAFRQRRMALGENHPDTLNSANGLAYDLCALGDAVAAEKLHRDTLFRFRQALGSEHPDTLRTASGLAFDLRTIGRIEEALIVDEENLNARRQVLGVDHPDTLGSEYSVAVDMHFLGRSSSAIEVLLDTVERRQRILGSDHPDTITAHTILDSWRTEIDNRSS